MMDKTAEKIRVVNKNFVEAVASGDDNRLQKMAAGIDTLFKTYVYTAGQQRKVYSALSGKDSLEVIPYNDPRREYDHVNEKTKMKFHLQPDFMRNSKSSAFLQSWAEGYLRRVSGDVFEGYFSELKPDPIIKKVDAIKSYGFDMLGLIREDNVRQILYKEDMIGYAKDFMLIAAQEAEGVGTGINVVIATDFEAQPHIALKETLKVHQSPKKDRQPRALVTMADANYLDFGTIDHNIVSNVAEDTLKNGYSSDEVRKLLGVKVLTFDDDMWLTYDGSSSGKESNWDGGAVENLQAMGYNTTGTPLDYGIVCTPNTWAKAATLKFKRSMVYAPKPFYGAAYLDESDIKTRIRTENEFVIVSSSEKLLYLAHNHYAVTAMDVWYV